MANRGSSVRRTGGPAILVLGLLVAIGCATAFTSPRALTYAPETGVDLSQMRELSSGLLIQDLSDGFGDREVRRGSRVAIHYIGQFPDGRKFDSSLDQGETMEFRLGRHEVILGWEEAVMGMKTGGRRKIVVPPQLAYGAQGVDDVVPPDQVLVFEIQLVKIF